MAAVKKKNGKATLVPETKVIASPIDDFDGSPEACDVSPAAADYVAMSRPIDRETLLFELEDDRRGQDRLSQRARERNDHEESYAARAVCSYIERLIEKLSAR